MNYFQSRKWIKNLVSIYSIQGCNLTDSKVYSNTIALFIEKEHCSSHQLPREISVKNNNSIRILHNCQNSYNYHQKKISRVLLIQNIIVIKGTNSNVLFDDGYDGQGGSNQAQEIQNEIRYIYNISSTPFVPSNLSQTGSCSSNHSFSSTSQINHFNAYLDKILRKLLQYEIQMILCPEPIPIELLDICTQYHIVILPCHPSLLVKFSHMLQVYILDDILDLTDDMYDSNSNNNFIEIQINDMVRYIDDSDGVQEGMILYTQQESIMFLLTVHKLNSDNCNPPILFPSYQPHTTVILSCPTGILGYQLQFRILRCLSRLSHLTSPNDHYIGHLLPSLSSLSSQSSSFSSQLICGGGLVELLCSI